MAGASNITAQIVMIDNWRAKIDLASIQQKLRANKCLIQTKCDVLFKWHSENTVSYKYCSGFSFTWKNVA